MTIPLFTGVCTALITPFEGEKLNLSLFEALLERQLAVGIPAVVVAGTTGESATLSHEEKLTLFRSAVRVANGRCKVIAGTGSNDTRASVALTREAAALGADAALCVVPYYNKPTQDGLIRHYAEIADKGALPLLLYNVPSRTGVRLLPESCGTLAKHPGIVGIKEADPDLAGLFRLRAACGADFPLYCGNDDRLVPFCAAGGVGAVSVLSNLLPRQAQALYRLCAAGRYPEAAALQTKLQPLIDALFAETNPIPVKAALQLLGYDCGPCRLPLTSCSPALLSRMRAQLSALSSL